MSQSPRDDPLTSPRYSADSAIAARGRRPVSRAAEAGVVACAGMSRRNATVRTVTTAAAIPNVNVLAVASENARWIAATISGMYGASCACAPAGAPARIARPTSPTPVS